MALVKPSWSRCRGQRGFDTAATTGRGVSVDGAERRCIGGGGAGRRHGGAEENMDSIEAGYGPFTDGYTMCARLYGPGAYGNKFMN
jgi:hypothetical protein